MTTSAPLLSVEGLSVDFELWGRNVPAVRDVSFQLATGEVLGIVGESGSGKSVTCRAILGLLPATAKVGGRVMFGGTDLCALSPADIADVRGRQISMIFQNPSSHLDPLMTIGGQIAEAPRLQLGKSRAEARSDAIRMLGEVRIRDPEHRVDSYPHELSGGMKQRAMIASAISCEPRLLLADEPTTALDVTVQARILELLKDLNQRRNLSVILISHDLGVISAVCDRVIVMRHGKVVESGPTEEIIQRPKEPYTRLLIDSQPSRRTPQRRMQEKPNKESILSLRNLTVEFSSDTSLVDLLRGQSSRRVRAVNNVSFDIAAGESFAIVGESGSGKSTIARAIARLNQPKSGSIRFDGQEAVALSGDALRGYRRTVQMVFQSPYDSLNPRMRVGDAIEEPLIRHGLARGSEAADRVHQLLEMVELPFDLRNRKPHELSGGQCQRVGIARALALSPRLLIADEITSALDVTIQAQILDLLRRLQQSQGLTMIYISHDLAVVRAFCDRVAVLSSGEIVEIGDVGDVLTAPVHEYTRTLIAAAPSLGR
jgi:peptide/nickel transport system ATP-binding protein